MGGVGGGKEKRSGDRQPIGKRKSFIFQEALAKRENEKRGGKGKTNPIKLLGEKIRGGEKEEGKNSKKKRASQ